MNVHIKTCGCGNQWKPMSKLDTRCWKCLRKDAEVLMEARAMETMAAPTLLDRCALGVSRPAPLRVPVKELVKTWYPAPGLSTPECQEYEQAFHGNMVLESGRLDCGKWWWRVACWSDVTDAAPYRLADGRGVDFGHNCSEQRYAKERAEKALAKDFES